MKYSLFAALSICLAIPVVRSVDHTVIVGGPGLLTFQPSSLEGAIGDTVLFVFKQKNHTVTQSTLAAPCSPLAGGFDSGFIPVADTVTDNFPSAQFVIRSLDPVWAYCKQANHCSSGMNFAINPGQKLAQFQANAKALASPPASTTSAASSVSVTTVTATVTVSNSVMTTTYTTAASAITTTPATTNTSTASTPQSTAPSSISTHKIVVGGPGVLVFNPPNITAQIGDTILFEFHQKNHSVVASSFASPCTPLGSTGFNSGFMPVADSDTAFPTFSVVVNNTTPVWVFCSQATHCGQGMVFAANAVETGDKNFAAFVDKAKTTITQNGANGVPANNAGALVVALFALLGALAAL